MHQLRNHLGVVIGFCDLLISELPPSDPRLADLETVRDAGLAALDLLPELLRENLNER